MLVAIKATLIYFCMCVYQLPFPLFFWVTLPCVSQLLIRATPNGGKQVKKLFVV
jgi:hypothetical protein